MKWLVPPLLFFLCLLGIAVTAYAAPGPQIAPPPFNWLGLLFIPAGLAFGASGSRQFMRVRTNLPTFNDPDKLVTDGVFAISRNPMYLGFSLVLAGAALLTTRSVPFAFVLLFFALARLWYVPFEERRLRAVFGDQYAAYCLTTRRWL